MKQVTFNQAYGLWNSGETASFSEAEAARLVAARVARPAVDPAAEEVVEDQPKTEPAPAESKRKGRK